MTKYYSLLLVLLPFFSAKGETPTTVTPLTNQVCIGIPTLISNIIITETLPNDFAISGSGTLVLEAGGGTFVVGGGETAQIEGSGGLSASISVTSTRITITLTESDNVNDTEINTLSISGIQYFLSSFSEEQISYSSESTMVIADMSFNDAVAYLAGSDTPVGVNDAVITCSNNALFYDLQGNIGVSGNFMWTAADNVNVEGESTSVNSGSYITDQIVNVSGTAQEVVYTITPTSEYGCTGNSFTVTATVNVAPVVTVTNNKPVISNGGTTDIQLTSNDGSTDFNYSGFNPPYVSGVGEDDTEGAINETIGNSGHAARDVQYQITVTGLNGCTSEYANTIVRVNGLASVIVSDSLALVALYNATDGPNWMNESGSWQAESVNDWYGVSVNSMRVTSVQLMSNGLSGTLPADIGLLTGLESLVITGGKDDVLIGSVPAEIGLLTNLTQLDLSNNALTSIPAELTNLTNLTTLQLGYNKITGAIPSGLNNLSNLVVLNLSHNEFTGAIPDFSGITGPVTLQLTDNNLTTIPDLSGWNFELLNLNDNFFTFDDIEPIAAVAGVYYDSQKPFDKGGYKKIGSGETFTATYTVGGSANSYQWWRSGEPIPGETTNSITVSDATPAESGAYFLEVTSSLVPSLNLRSDPIFLTVSSVNTADSLAVVALYNATNGGSWNDNTNWLTGPFENWQGLTIVNGRITEIHLQDNNLTGTLPPAIGDLTKLTYLELGGTTFDQKSTNPLRNKMSGNIPATIGNLTDLTYLNLSSNNFTGALPATFSNLVLLQELWLSGNDLSLGAFPPAILSMTNLESLKLSYAGITGTIPSGIQNLTLLRSLVLNNNAISGVPAELSSLTSLEILYLNKNLLSALPDLTPLSALSNGHVEDNQLTFEDIEPNTGVAIIYAPQDSVGVKSEVLFQTSTPGTLTSSVGGSANLYQWKKDGVAIGGSTASSITLPAPAFADEGKYSFEVTSSLVPGLTLISRPQLVKVSSLKRDSLALVQFYNATKGSAWKNKTGWLTGRLNTWIGVTISSNRVTDLSLANNGLEGAVPGGLADILNLKTVNVTGNKISSLPSLAPLSQLTSFNVSSNNLDFASLENNVAKLGIINYANQAPVGQVVNDSIPVGSTYTVSVVTAGVNNNYQWKRNTVTLASATASTYTIPLLDKSTMGEYVCEITNTVVPGLKLTSALKTVLAITELSGKLLIEASPVAKGKVTLFRVTAQHAYDTVKIVNVDANGAYKFPKVVLDNYQILGFADPSVNARALPTYYKKTTLWEEAEVLTVTGSRTDLDIVSELKPTTGGGGTGIIKGIVEEEIVGLDGGRIMAKARLSNAGVSARRVENNGRTQGEVFTLVAYVFTNSNGEFEITGMPVGNYKLNIQYPGYPMDEKSFISFPIGTGDDAKINVEALVANDKITVRQLTITGLETVENYQAEVYPIPSREDIMIRFASPSPQRTIEMIDVTGRKVMLADAREQRISVNVRSIERGVYILNVNDKNDTVKKLRVVIE